MATLVSTINPYPYSKPKIEYHNNPMFEKQIRAAFAHSQATGRNEILKIENSKEARRLKGKHSIQKIFQIYWDDFYQLNKHRITRSGIVSNINKVISCKDISRGFLFYDCPNCENYHITGLTCKTRFCTSCGKKYADARGTAINKKCINAPHRHMVFTVPYELLRKTYQRCLLDQIHKYFGNSFKKDKSRYYRKYKKGFYVYAPRLQSNRFKGGLKDLVKYITRYAGHPPMSKSRIINVDYKNDKITYYYDPHEDDNKFDPTKPKGRQYITEDIFDFISKLIVHIPDTSKHNVRYYGFYSNKTNIDSSKDVSKLFTKYDILNMRKMQRYSYRLYKSYGYEIYL